MVKFCDYFYIQSHPKDQIWGPCLHRKVYTMLHFMKGNWNHWRTTKQAITTTCLLYSTRPAKHTDGPHPRKAEICQESDALHLYTQRNLMYAHQYIHTTIYSTHHFLNTVPWIAYYRRLRNCHGVYCQSSPFTVTTLQTSEYERHEGSLHRRSTLSLGEVSL